MKHDPIVYFHARPVLCTSKENISEKQQEENNSSSPVSDSFSRTLPEEFLLLKYGKNSYTKNAEEGEFYFTPEDADIVTEDFIRRGKDLVNDFEHQSVSGKKAPAAGWIKKLEKNDSGLVAIVKYWTKEAEELILKGQYRYFSPVLYFSEDTGRIISIHSVALTNHPALHALSPLAADDLAVMEDRKFFCAEKATEILSSGKFSDLPAEVKLLLQDLEIKEKVKEEFFREYNISSFDDARQMLLQAEEIHRKEKLRLAFSKGILTENMRSWAEKMLRETPELFDHWCQTAPRLVPDNLYTDQAALSGREPSGNDPLEEEIFSMLGLTPKDAEKQVEKI